jgi:hypothetical protein
MLSEEKNRNRRFTWSGSFERELLSLHFSRKIPPIFLNIIDNHWEKLVIPMILIVHKKKIVGVSNDDT